MAQRYEGHFKATHGSELFYQSWNVASPRGTIVVTHGIAEHSECYEHFANSLNQDRWNVFAWDLRGHGRSEGKRGYVADFSEYIDDLYFFIELMKKDWLKAGPIVLFGHSMGGLITLKFVLDKDPGDIDAVALSSPALGLAVNVPKLKKKFAEIAADWLPKVTLFNEINYNDLVSDPILAKSYESDPLRHDKISPRLFLGMENAFKQVLEGVEKVQLPLILQLAGKEKIVSTPTSIQFFNQLTQKNKKMLIYDESLHEIFNDLQRDSALRDLKNFLNQFESKGRS